MLRGLSKRSLRRPPVAPTTQSAGTVSEADARRLAEVKVLLDQCWDLLRQRRALREAELDPEGAHVRQPEVVERYQQ